MNGLNERKAQRIAMKRRLVAMTAGVVLVAGIGMSCSVAATPVSLSNQAPSIKYVDQDDGSTFSAEDDVASVISALQGNAGDDEGASAQ